jgi:hypothetical protein
MPGSNRPGFRDESGCEKVYTESIVNYQKLFPMAEIDPDLRNYLQR